MKAILIIDHGSVRPAANHMLDCVGELLQQMVGESVIVRVAHMELAEPTIGDGFEACVAAGATEVIAFPYMLSPGKHSTRDIPRLVAAAAAGHPHVTFSVTPAFGVHEKLAAVICERAGVLPVGAGATAASCVRPQGAAERHCGEACPEHIRIGDSGSGVRPHA
jgi:sirohydrochlorin ferrochelatase